MKKLALIFSLFGLLAACQKATTENDPLMGRDEIDVRFFASLSGATWPEGAVVGIVATCVRDGAEGTQMSASRVARFVAGGDYLLPESENDKVIAKKNDHAFNFVAIYPCPAENVDLTAVPVSVPAVQDGQSDISSKLVCFGSASPITVLPPVELVMASPFSVLTFNVPTDVLTGTTTVLKKMNISIADGALAQEGTYNVLTSVFTPLSSSQQVSVDFGEGLNLASSSQVKFVTTPFTVPDGGLKVVLNEGDGAVTNLDALTSEKEIGKQIKAGEVYSTTLTSGDGIVPVKFPVLFPMGFSGTDRASGYFYYPAHSWFADWTSDEAFANFDMWTGQHGKVYCMEQPQAYMTWNWGEEINKTGIKHRIYFVNELSVKCSTPWPVGVWTGDYYEFVLPVRKFEAGTTLQLKAALFTRKGPTFYEVLYKDGDEWKSTAKDNLPAYVGSSVTARATWAVPYHETKDTDENEQSVNMTFTKAVASGEIRIRIQCVDGSIISFGKNNITTGNKAPNSDLNGANAPLYFFNLKERDNQAISIDLF